MPYTFMAETIYEQPVSSATERLQSRRKSMISERAGLVWLHQEMCIPGAAAKFAARLRDGCFQ